MRSLMFACVAGVASAIASGLLAGQVDIVLKQPSGDWQQSGVGEIRHLAFSPNGKILYAANDRAVAWNLETQECLGVSPMLLEHVRVLPSGHPQRMGRLANILAFSPDGVTVVAEPLVFERKGELGAGATSYGEAFVKATTRPGTEALLTHKDVTISPGALSPVSKSPFFALSMLASECALYDVRTSKRGVTIEKRPFAIMQDAIRFSPDGHTLAGAVLNRKVTVGPSAVSSNTEGYAIVLWDTGTGEVKTTIDAFATGVECIAFSQDGSLLASGGGHHWKKGARCERCELRIWDTRSGKLSLNLAGHGDLPDGKYLRTGYGISHLVSDDGSMVRAPGKHSGVVGVVAFSPDGRLLMSSSGGETKLWDTRDGSLIHTIPARNLGTRRWSASCACFSPDSRTLAIGGTWSKILLIDTAAGAVDTSLAELDIASCHISALIFSPDGNTLVSGDSSGTVRLWDWKLTWAVKDGPRRGDHR